MPEPWSKFFWSDWEADQGLRLCSLAAQGLWMRMLCVCARHEPKGYLAINGNPLGVDAIARLAGVTETEAGNLIAELEANGVFSRDRSRRIYSRRMVRDEKRSKEGRKWKKHGLAEAAEKTAENPAPSRVPTRGPSAQKPEARGEEKEAPNGASKKKPGRGSRLPPDWRLPVEWVDWAVREGLDEASARREGERFRDYWHSVPGQRGVKLDWEATWRVWIRKAVDERPRRPASRGSVHQIGERKRIADGRTLEWAGSIDQWVEVRG